jgi:glycosyltransferase involved in cell wall biosynthesis
MGKKSSNNNSNQSTCPKVSILSVTQPKRIPFLHNLSKMIQSQTESTIFEWVIVNGSNNDEDYEKFIEDIKQVTCGNIPIKIASSNKLKSRFIGAFRNFGNKSVSGDIIICMDDDDFYFNNYVSTCVDIFDKKKEANLIGCSSMLMYDYGFDTVFRLKPFCANHTVNCCMAYKKEYANTHLYDETTRIGEEKSFLNSYQNKMEQLPALSAIIHMSYSDNTFSGKRENMLGNMTGYVRNPSSIPQIYTPVKSSLKSLIKNDEIFDSYMEIFKNINDQKETDVVFYYGNIEDKWDPSNKDLTVYRRRCLDVGREFIKHGLTVSVYGKFDFNEKEIDGVIFYNLRFWNVRRKTKYMIFSDFTGFVPVCQTERVFEKINCEKIFLDCQHNCFNFYPFMNEYNCKKIIFTQKSQYQHLMNPPNVQLPKFDYTKIVIPNGVNLELFKTDYGLKREPKRFCYTSNYSNGLDVTLENTWPTIRSAHPDAELHIYYGMNGIAEEQQLKFKKLFMQDGVFEHGRVSHDEIAKEMQKSSFLLYYTGSPNETDGLSIMEAMASGCIPIIWNKNLFSRFNGLVCDVSPMELKGHVDLGEKLVNLLHNDSDRDRVSSGLQNSNLILSNTLAAQIYMNAFNGTYIKADLQAQQPTPPAPPKDFDLPSNIDLSKYVDSDSDSDVEYESDSDKEENNKSTKLSEPTEQVVETDSTTIKISDSILKIHQIYKILQDLLPDNTVVKHVDDLKDIKFKEFIQVFASGKIEVVEDTNINNLLADYYNQVKDTMSYDHLTRPDLDIAVKKIFGYNEQHTTELPSNHETVVVDSEVSKDVDV